MLDVSTEAAFDRTRSQLWRVRSTRWRSRDSHDSDGGPKPKPSFGSRPAQRHFRSDEFGSPLEARHFARVEGRAGPSQHAARRGRQGANRLLPSAIPRPSGGRDLTRVGDWTEAATISEQTLADTGSSLWRGRFVMYSTVAEVEPIFDPRATRTRRHRKHCRELLDRIEFARRTAQAARGTTEALDTSAHLAQASARADEAHRAGSRRLVQRSRSLGTARRSVLDRLRLPRRS